MIYYFKYKDSLLATFRLLENGVFTLIQNFTESNQVLYMLQSPTAINKWVLDRQGISRPFAGDIFKLGDIKNDINFVDVSLCLSLKDCFWLSSDNSLKWKDSNLFDNSFSRAYTNIASGLERFKGVVIKTPSPEFSALGGSCKFYRKQSDGIYLYKTFGGIAELEYSGVYSEYLVCQLLEFLGMNNYVNYDIIEYDGRLFSKSKVFTNEFVNMIDIEDLVSDSIHLDEHIKNYRGIMLQQFCDMMVIDALVLNVDRHCENIAILYDNNLTMYSVAPMFDFDHSLFYDLPLINRTKNYVIEKLNSYMPKTWSDHTFKEQVRYCCYPELYKKLKTIRGTFEFKNHPKYPMTKERLKMINQVFRLNYNHIMKGFDEEYDRCSGKFTSNRRII